MATLFEAPIAHEAHEWEDEWETQEASHYSPEAHEWEDEWEADQFLGGALRRLGKLAKRFAPALVGKLAGMIPGAGIIAGPLAAQLTSQLIREGEMEAT